MSDLTILVPLDGSGPGEQALSFLPALKPLGDFSVRLLYVISDDAGSIEEERRREVAAAQYLDTVGSRTEAITGLRTERIRRIGVPHAEILEEAGRADVNLVLMSTHGHTSGEGERLGSVADKVVRGTICPILLVGPHASVPPQVQQITVPLDGSGLAAEALPVARFLAERLNCRLRLVRAVEYPLPADNDGIGSLAADVVQSLELTASQYLSEATLELETSRPVDTAVLSGRPVEALLTDLKENTPDLLVMTSHGRTGFFRWALGSVTDRLIRGPVPVLVLRPLEHSGDRLIPLTAR